MKRIKPVKNAFFNAIHSRGSVSHTCDLIFKLGWPIGTCIDAGLLGYSASNVCLSDHLKKKKSSGTFKNGRKKNPQIKMILVPEFNCGINYDFITTHNHAHS